MVSNVSDGTLKDLYRSFVLTSLRGFMLVLGSEGICAPPVADSVGRLSWEHVELASHHGSGQSPAKVQPRAVFTATGWP